MMVEAMSEGLRQVFWRSVKLFSRRVSRDEIWPSFCFSVESRF